MISIGKAPRSGGLWFIRLPGTSAETDEVLKEQVVAFDVYVRSIESN